MLSRLIDWHFVKIYASNSVQKTSKVEILPRESTRLVSSVEYSDNFKEFDGLLMMMTLDFAVTAGDADLLS